MKSVECEQSSGLNRIRMSRWKNNNTKKSKDENYAAKMWKEYNVNDKKSKFKADTTKSYRQAARQTTIMQASEWATADRETRTKK